MPEAQHTIHRYRGHSVRARYDAAQTTDENKRHWAAADAFDSDACNNLGVRMILRNRARYVFANNPRARGMILTLATHTIGTGPRLQMLLGSGTQARKLSKSIETSFRSWAKEIRLAKKLRTIRIAKVISGEIFPLLTFNPKLTHDIKLDVQLIEADQVSNLQLEFPPKDIDGVFLDEYGNPDFYRILKYHPGAMFRSFDPLDSQDVPAKYCLHYYGSDRPGQHRGIPEITPAVQLVEEGRRFRAAVLGAAETAAYLSMALESDAPADVDGAAKEPSAMDVLELEKRVAMVLPKGFRLVQTKAEQPTTTFKEFSRELLAEVARCLQMPISIATMDANDANMSSSYVINQPYEKAIEVERGDIEDEILEPILDRWLTIAFDQMGTPIAKRVPDEFPHDYHWPLIGEHADPGKRASAEDIQLKNNSTTYAAIYGRRGLDWEEEFEQIAKEKARLKELAEEYGLDPAEMMPAPSAGQQQQTGDPNADPTSPEDSPANNPTPRRNAKANRV